MPLMDGGYSPGGRVNINISSSRTGYAQGDSSRENEGEKKTEPACSLRWFLV